MSPTRNAGCAERAGAWPTADAPALAGYPPRPACGETDGVRGDFSSSDKSVHPKSGSWAIEVVKKLGKTRCWIEPIAHPPGASSHRPTGPASGRHEDGLRPVPMAAMGPGLRRDDKEEGSFFRG